MKEWRQTIIAIGTAVPSIIAIVTTMQFQFAGMRAEMRAGFDVIRVQMRDEHAAMRSEHADIRMEMRDEHAAMRGEHVDIRMEMRAGLDTVRAQARTDHAATLNELATIRDQLTSVDRRTARIEGSLFGVEVAPDQQAAE